MLWILSALGVVTPALHAQQVPVRSAAVEVRLDAAEGVPFGRISGLALAASSSDVFLVDELSQRVHRFTAEGRRRYSFGGLGQGPGEFRSPCCPALGPDGLLWVHSGANSLEGFRVGDGGVTPDERFGFFQASREVIRPMAPAFSGDSVLILTSHSERESLRRWYSLVEVSRDRRSTERKVLFEAPTDSIDYFVTEGPSGLQIPLGVPNGRGYVTTMARDGRFAWADNSRYEIAVLAADGTHLLSVRRELHARPLTSAQRDSVLERISVYREGTGGAGVSIIRVPDPQVAPILDGLWFDSAGRLWVALEPEPGSEVRRADVYDQEGSLLFQAEWPGNISLSFGAARDSLAWGVEFGPFDEPSLVLLEFE